MSSRKAFTWLLQGASFALAASFVSARADAPSVEHIFPAGLHRGATNELTVAGKLDPWPVQAWVSCPGVAFCCATNKGRLQATVASDAPLGAHLVRFYNTDGTSAPKLFVITDKLDLLETEPNDRFDQPQAVPQLPVTINGRLNKTGDVDSFAVTLRAGQWLDAGLDAYTLASKVDALLRVVTPDGVQQAWNHDFASLDPHLWWQAPTNGTYVVQVMGFKYPADAEVRLTGGDGCVYRLHLDAVAERRLLTTKGLPECEPNNSPAQAALLELPGAVRGSIDSAGDEDWFAINAIKNQVLEVSLKAASLGSPLNGWLKLTDTRGHELARAEELGQFRDPHLEWKPSTNATVYVTVGNVLHAGAPEDVYALFASCPKPDYRATVAVSAVTLAPGETNELKLTVARLHGFDRELAAKVVGLSPGLHAPSVTLPREAGEVSLKLSADPDAAPASGPIRVVLSEVGVDEERPAVFLLTSASEDNGVPGGYTTLLVDSTDVLWLTVKAKATH